MIDRWPAWLLTDPDCNPYGHAPGLIELYGFHVYDALIFVDWEFPGRQDWIDP
jgi:hypothetical protein